MAKVYSSIAVSITSMLLFASCIVPSKRFESYTASLAPDYAQEQYWAALPGKKDSADAVPVNSRLQDNQAIAKADVFYIHPTVYLTGKHWNASINDEKINRKVDEFPVRHQASIFNGSCKVYAPRYRQAVLFSFFDKKEDGRKALDLAYTDVKRAFEYYLQHYNQGRPIVIASHSQGTHLAVRLIKDFFEKNRQLYQQLVVAYLVGGPVGKDIFSLVTPCKDPSQTGCFVAWNTVSWGTPPTALKEKWKTMPVFDHYTNRECINPLTWKNDTVYAPASLNLGAVPTSFDRIDTGLIDAKCTPEGMLWVHPPKAKGYPGGNNYHIADYNLFYMNIRENVKHRIAKYLQH